MVRGWSGSRQIQSHPWGSVQKCPGGHHTAVFAGPLLYVCGLNADGQLGLGPSKASEEKARNWGQDKAEGLGKAVTSGQRYTLSWGIVVVRTVILVLQSRLIFWQFFLRRLCMVCKDFFLPTFTGMIHPTLRLLASPGKTCIT